MDTTRRRLVLLGLGVGVIALILAGCRIVPNTNPEDEALNLANPKIPTSAAVPLTPQPGASEPVNNLPTVISITPMNQINQPAENQGTLPETVKTATITTSKGEIRVRLYSNKAPNTVKNFTTKAGSGFYDNLTFHRVEDWVIQGGDPQGTGTGGGTMPTELNDVPFKEGSLGVARGGNKAISNDAQFFICTKDCSWLTGDYTNFGEVTAGMEVVKQIQVGDTITGILVTGT